ncbi:MAG: hypothetical protein A2Z96_07590 [Spirochaetes bacterium GWB1_48_6]|nr:MAG: hypothetical protein A2Z96_07590 [Spirochaetes bacterium GWB1_48_6]
MLQVGALIVFSTDFGWSALADSIPETRTEIDWFDLLSGTAVLSPRISLDSSVSSFVAAPRIRMGNALVPYFDLDELSLAIRALGILEMKFGVFRHQPGTALFFSNVEYFSHSDPLRLMEEGLQATVSPNALASIQVLGDRWYAGFLVAPLVMNDSLVPTDSPWFPRKDIRASYKVGSYTFRLNNLAWETQPAILEPEIDISYSGEAGFSAGGFDGSLILFDGRDRSYCVTSLITMPASPWGVYDITLAPVYGHSRQVGTALSMQLDVLRFWIDSSAFWDKTIATKELYNASTGWETATRTIHGISLTGGFSWNLPIPDGLFAVETRYSLYADNETGDTYPFLDRIATAVLSGSFLDQAFNYSLLSFVSLSDYSLCIISSISMPFGADHQVSFTVPLFIGQSDTDFGQYSGQNRMKINLVFQL